MLLALPSVTFAQYDEEADDSSTTVTNQSTVNNIIVDQIKTTAVEQSIEQQQKQQNGLQKSRGSTFSGYAGAQFVYSSSDTQIFNIPLGLGVGYGFGVEVNVPIVFTKGVDLSSTSSEKKNYSGLGDISAGINYHFGLPSTNGLSIVTVLYKSTTGDEKKYLGSGADAYSFSYKYLKRLGGKYSLHLLGSYTINGDYTDQYNTKVDYGDAYMAMIGGSMPCLLSDKVTTSAKVTYFHSDKTKYGGTSWADDSRDIADLWIQWDSTQLISGVPLGLGVKIPLVNKIKDDTLKDPDKKFSFYLSVSGLF